MLAENQVTQGMNSVKYLRSIYVAPDDVSKLFSKRNSGVFYTETKALQVRSSRGKMIKMKVLPCSDIFTKIHTYNVVLHAIAASWSLLVALGLSSSTSLTSRSSTRSS